MISSKNKEFQKVKQSILQLIQHVDETVDDISKISELVSKNPSFLATEVLINLCLEP